MEMKNMLYTIFLWWSVIGFSVWVGGTIFNMSVIVPMWNYSVPESVRFFFGQTRYPKTIYNFFGPPWMAIRSLPLFITLFLGWNFRPQRKYLLIASVVILFGIIFTLVYVYPINDELIMKAGVNHSADQIKVMARHWIIADRIRFVLMLLGFFSLLKVFSLPIIKH